MQQRNKANLTRNRKRQISENWTPVGMVLVQQWEDATGLKETE